MKYLFLFLLSLCLSASAQTLIADYGFGPGLKDASANQNHLHAYGVGNPYAFVQPGSTNVSANDTCINFNGGTGLESAATINNGAWKGTAISFWINAVSPSAMSTTGFVIQGAYSGFGVRLYNGRIAAFFDGTTAGAVTSQFQFGIQNMGWHHVVAQNNGTTTTIYVDGVVSGQQTDTLYTLPAPNATAKLYIGTAVTHTGTDRLSGVYLDELKVFDAPLTPSQISELLQHHNPTVTGVEDVADASSVVLSPNPCSGSVSLSVKHPFLTGNAVILNVLGQTVVAIPVLHPAQTIDLPAGAGVYFLRAVVDGKVLESKIISQ